MKPASRPQYYRIKRIVDMVREGSEGGFLPNRGDFRRELEVSPRTLARDLDFLRDEERAPIEYDATRHGYRLTDETYRLPPVRISRKEAFGFALARRLLAAFEGTPLHLEMRTVLGKLRVTFQNAGGGLRTRDEAAITGFEIAGKDGVFHPAAATIAGNDQIELSAESVPEPMAVRHAWADVPAVNLVNSDDLPAAAFQKQIAK